MNMEDNEYLRDQFISEKSDDCYMYASEIDNSDVVFSDEYVFWLEQYVIDLREMLKEQ